MANIIFDYDGTLHDCIKIYAPAFRKAYDHLVYTGLVHQKSYTDYEISKWLGFSAKDMWDNFAPHISEKEKTFCSQIIGDEMLRLIKNGQAQLYPNVETMLQGLLQKRHNLIFLSNCKHSYMQIHREYFKLEKYFSDFYCAEDYNWKPKYEIFNIIKDKYNEEFIVVGDRFHDIDIAKRHGLKSIGCIYGYGCLDELKNATAIAKSPMDILQIINNF